MILKAGREPGKKYDYDGKMEGGEFTRWWGSLLVEICNSRDM